MKAHKVALLALLAAVLVASGVAYADLLEGTVASIDLAGNKIGVTKADGTNVSVGVSDVTTYSGEVTALAEVVEGDSVKLEVEQDAATGNWTAKSVDVSFAE